MTGCGWLCAARIFDGLPLNGQLRRRGARLVEATLSAPRYKLYALTGDSVARAGMVRVETDGAAIAVEVGELPSAEVGSFLAGIPAPLGLSTIELGGGSWETGFVCEQHGLQNALDITHSGGWRAWLSRAP
jgi:allophanate hydrolase